MIIESLQNTTIKKMTKLLQKKERDATGTFLVEGEHLVEEAFKAGVLEKVFVRSTDKRGWPCPAIQCSQAVLNKLSVQKSDASIIGLCKKPRLKPKKQNAILVLEKVQDPGNVGTLIRSALAFGMDEILLSKDCADIYNPKTIQSAQGAIFHIPITVTDLPERLNSLQKEGISVLSAALHQASIPSKNLTTPDKYALCIGNEGQGLSLNLLNLSNEIIHIEMEDFESLNAAVAGSILMYRLQMLPNSL